ncbi:MAG: hypothetical protein MEQ84_07900 [Mesorhizobium sp.]|nr:hypothetical protein [Mesorhizobium sp.]
MSNLDPFPDPLQIFTNQDWRDTLTLVEGEDDTVWEIPDGTPIRMQIRDRACSDFIELELSTANGRLIISEGVVAFNVSAATIRDRLGPADCEDRQFEADIVAHIEERDVIVGRFGITVSHGVTR